MQRTGWIGVIVTGLLMTGLPGSARAAAPAIWETTLGKEITQLTGTDDTEQAVTLSFDFPFKGAKYRTLYVNTNGEIHVNGEAITSCCPDAEDLLEAEGPIIAPFWGDLSLMEKGNVYAKDFGNRAVITWWKSGSYEDGTAPFTFQAQLLNDGRIIFGYNGISNLTTKLASDLVIGVSAGSGPLPPARDLSIAPFDASTQPIVYEALPEGSAATFDLDSTNVVFTPTTGGWQVAKSTTLPAPLSPVTLCNDATPPANYTCGPWYQDTTQFCPYQTYQNRVKDCTYTPPAPPPTGPITICNSATPPAGYTCGAAYTGTLYCPTQLYKYRNKNCVPSP